MVSKQPSSTAETVTATGPGQFPSKGNRGRLSGSTPTESSTPNLPSDNAQQSADGRVATEAAAQMQNLL